MKLHAMIQTDRGLIGQGGDEYMDIRISNYEQKPVMRFRVEHIDNQATITGAWFGDIDISIMARGLHDKMTAQAVPSPDEYTPRRKRYCEHDYDRYRRCTKCGWKDRRGLLS